MKQKKGDEMKDESKQVVTAIDVLETATPPTGKIPQPENDEFIEESVRSVDYRRVEHGHGPCSCCGPYSE